MQFVTQCVSSIDVRDPKPCLVGTEVNSDGTCVKGGGVWFKFRGKWVPSRNNYPFCLIFQFYSDLFSRRFRRVFTRRANDLKHFDDSSCATIHHAKCNVSICAEKD